MSIDASEEPDGLVRLTTHGRQPFRTIPVELFMTEAPARTWLAA